MPFVFVKDKRKATTICLTFSEVRLPFILSKTRRTNSSAGV
ncbi:hypothetical protein ADUPG1_004663, partial [Aduncisulcus paluster]